MTTAYLAGPMTGIPEFNFPAFDAAAERWRAMGITVISPAEHDREEGLDVTGLTGTEDLTDQGFDLQTALLWDLAQVAKADIIIVLEGWERSSGTRAELATAAALGKMVIEDAGETTDPVPAKDLLAAKLHAPEKTSAPLPGGEVRITSATGGQKGSKPQRYDLIPHGPLKALATHFGVGALKYADDNWRLGTDWNLNFAALNRHLWAFWDGEDFDEETGSKHIIAVAWHAFVLAEFMDTHPELDTRPRTKALRMQEQAAA